MKHPKLINLMSEMADLTLPECKKCPNPLSCCSPEYCAMAIQYAKEVWDVELQTTSHDRLPLMGLNGCVAPPHLRPLCTLHTCKINSVGTSGNPEWDKRYFELRDQIDTLEFE